MENEKVALSYAELREKYREHAGHEFDTAVALSSDGKKVRHADYVVVYKKRGEALAFSCHQGALFHQHKVRLEPCKVIRHPATGTKKRILEEEVLIPAMIGQWLVKAQPKTQVFLIMGKLRVLMVPAEAVSEVLRQLLAAVSIEAEHVFSGSWEDNPKDQPLIHPFQNLHRRHCTDGRMCYCAPFDAEDAKK